MGWFSTLISGGVDKLVTATGEAIDRVVTSDEERLKLQNELVQIKLAAELDAQKMELDADAKVEAEVSARWTSDMASDDKWAKRVRPFSLVFLMLSVTAFAVLDGNLFTFAIKPAYIDLFQALLMLVFGAYFSARTLEKVMGVNRDR
jgi:hypothetical protein